MTFLPIPIVDSAKILSIHPSPSRSHVIIMQSLLKGLAAKGHEVTLISSFPLSKPMKNYRDIVDKSDLEMVHKSKKGIYGCKIKLKINQ